LPPKAAGDVVVSSNDGGIGLGGPGDGGLEVVIEALVGLIFLLADDVVASEEARLMGRRRKPSLMRPLEAPVLSR
jgi:hypothetical protein